LNVASILWRVGWVREKRGERKREREGRKHKL